MMTVWLAQVVLAVVFLLHGILMLVLPARLRAQMSTLPGGPPFYRLIGLAEVLASAGLTLMMPRSSVPPISHMPASSSAACPKALTRHSASAA